jgi:hypothetical protein
MLHRYICMSLRSTTSVQSEPAILAPCMHRVTRRSGRCARVRCALCVRVCCRNVHGAARPPARARARKQPARHLQSGSAGSSAHTAARATAARMPPRGRCAPHLELRVVHESALQHNIGQVCVLKVAALRDGGRMESVQRHAPQPGAVPVRAKAGGVSVCVLLGGGAARLARWRDAA